MQVPATERQFARFGPFVIDLVSRELSNNGRKINLQEKPFQVLAILIDHPGQLVTREQFRERLWPADTFVDFEHSINTAIKKVREALEDDAEQPRFIETMPKRGYRFIAPVADVLVEEERTAPPQNHVSLPGEPPGWRRTLDRRYVILFGAIVLAGVIVAAINLGSIRRLWQQRTSQRGISPRIESLAVLPLQNLSQNPDEEYFADGLTDALITDLGKVAGLRVISRTSVMSYKKTSKPLPQIASELNVDAIVEGTVLRSGSRIRVTVQLVRASPEEHLWAERYERDTQEVIRLEQRLALAIAHQVTGRLITAEQAAATIKQTTNPNAYDAYLRGRYLWNERSAKPASEAAAYFEQALREDPNFALAYSGLADYYTVGWGPWIDLPRAEAYARKALALEPGLAEAHASLGIASQYERNFGEAEKELKRAIELNPNYAMAHHWYSMHLLGMGHVNEALAENDRARRLDPFSFPINFFRAVVLTGMHEYGQAVEQLEAAAAINPKAYGVHASLARIYWIQGKGSEAMAEEREEANLTKDPARLRRLDQVARLYANADLRAAQHELARLNELVCANSKDTGSPDSCDEFTVALQYGILGEKEKLLFWLKRGLLDRVRDQNAMLVISLKTAPEFDCLRSDPRFPALLHSIGLPD